MGTSLEQLVNNLQNDEFKLLRKYIDGKDKQELMLRKGVYPYDYVDKPKKLEETRLPSKEEVYSNEGISDEDYQHAENVWRTFNCQH